MNNIKRLYIDLDGTLYDRSNGLLDAMTGRIEEYAQQTLGVSPQTSDHYYQQYGTTLHGLQLHHPVDREDYLAHVHDIDLASFLTPDLQLRWILSSLPMPKWIFTNSTREYAERVLDLLDLSDLFEDILDLRSMDFIPKPNPLVYRHALELTGNPDSRTCMFIDDSHRNLLPAWELGFTTVWVNRTPQRPYYASHRISRLHTLPALFNLSTENLPLTFRANHYMYT